MPSTQLTPPSRTSGNSGKCFAEFPKARPLSWLLRELIEASHTARHPEVAQSLPSRLRDGGRYGRPVWGLALVEAAERWYSPTYSGNGTLALITAAFDGIDLVDLVATSPFTLAMRRRTGEAAFLNEDAIEFARDQQRPVRLYANGYSWLCASCRGAVVLDWPRAVHRLAEAPAIVCETAALARDLRRAFERPLPLPPLFAPPATTDDQEETNA